MKQLNTKSTNARLAVARRCRAVATALPMRLESRRLMAAIAVYNFNDAATTNGSGAANEALLLSVDRTAPSITATLSTSFPVANVMSFTGTTIAADGGDPAGAALALQQGTANANNGGYLQENVTTTGYSNIGVSFVAQRTATGFTTVQLQYAVDGTTFVNFGNAFTPPAAFATAGATDTLDLSSVTSLNNDPNAAFRLVFNGATGTGTTGNNRLDNLVVFGTLGTTPGTPVVGGLSAAPNPVAVGTDATLTATGVAETGGFGSVTGVTFYRETNGVAGFQAGDTPVATGSAGSAAGTYTGSASSSGLAVGAYTFYAVATDSNGATSPAASTSLTVSGGVTAAFANGTFNVTEADGTATVTIGLASPAPSAGTVSYAVTTGTRPADPTAQQPDVAVAGRDFTAVSGTLPVKAGDTSETFTVPLTNLATFAGTRNANLTLTAATGGAVLGTATTATLAIADNQYAPANPTQIGVTTYSAELTTTTPVNANGFAALSPSATNGFGSGANVGPDAPFLEFGSASAVETSSPLTAKVDSLKLSLYNTAATGGAGTFNGIPGSFDLYLLSSDSAAPGTTPTYSYLGGDGNTGPTVVGSQGGPLLVGSAFFPDAAVGFNDYTFDNLPSLVSSTLSNLVNNKLPIRFVITPSQGQPTSADWQGNTTVAASTGNKPELVLLSEASTATAETFTTDQAAVTVPKAATAAIVVDRNGDTSDAATVAYTTANGTAAAGTDYTAVSGTATFAAGQSQATINVPIAPTGVAGGDRTFTVTISAPTVGNTAAHTAVLGTQQTTTVTIHDARTVSVSTVAGNVATVQPAGPRAAPNGTNFLNVEGAGAGTNASFGVIDFNTNTSGSSFPTGQTVGVLNGLTLSLGNSPAAFTAAGPFDVYLVENTTTSIASTNTALKFSTAANPVEGLDTQLGTKHLLGSFTFSASQSTTALTGFLLTSPDVATTALIGEAIGNGTPIRLALTPENSTVAATFAGLAGLVPTLSANYTPASATQLPFYLDPASVATFDPASNTVTATGSTIFVADPGTLIAPTTIAAATAAKITTNTVVGSQVHLAALTLTNGGTFAIANAATRPLVLDVANNAVSIDATSKLDLGTGDLDVAAGDRNAIRALVVRGYANGTWAGTGITSSAAAADATRRTAVGLLLNNTDGSTPIRTTFDGNPAPAATDVLLKYTYYGDANLDGVVNGADYVRVDAGYAAASTSTPLTGWSNGDFNYDGRVDGSDYTLIDNAFNLQTSTLAFAPQAVVTPVAAPAAVVALAATAKLAAAPVFSDTAITAASAFPAAGDKRVDLASQLLDLTGDSAK